MPTNNIDPVEVIISAYKETEKENGASLREFSRYLEIHPSTLSKILSKQRGVPKSLATKLAEKLLTDSDDRISFIESVLGHQKSRKQQVVEEVVLKDSESQDLFFIISQWEFFAILNVLGLKNFDHQPQFIARSLNLSTKRVNQCLEILERNKFIEFKNNRIVRKVRKITTTNDISSRALKLGHLEELDIAKAKMELPLERRYYQSEIFRIATKDIPKAKKVIDRMYRDLNKLTDDSDPEEVYVLASQLFPLSQPVISKESQKHVLH